MNIIQLKKIYKKKLSGDLNKFSSNIIGVPPEVKNSELRISDFKDKLYSKRYKDDQSIITNEEIENNKKHKKKDINQIQSFRNKLYKLNIDKKKCYIQESNNAYKDYFSRNISAKKSSENIKRNLSIHNEKNKIYLKKCNEMDNINENNNNVDEIKREIYINNENDINLDEEKIKEHELKNENDKLNSSKMRKNQIFKKIFLNKIKQNSRNIYSGKKQNSLKENHSQIDILNNNFEMIISPLGDVGEGIVTKDEFFKIKNECKIPTFNENNIRYIKKIGQGSFGIIYLVEDTDTKNQFALKRVLCQDMEQILKHKKEFELCYSLNHPNIIKIYNVLFKYLDMTTYLLFVLMEKAETDWNTEIENRIKSQNFYKESELINILKQLVSCFYYLQKKNIAHRDIKPQNILIFNNSIYKITDLGEARNNLSNSELSTLKGSQLFMSPNLFFVLKYDGSGVRVKHNLFKSDVFSLGYCFLYAMSLDLRLIKNLREETAMFDVFSIMKRFGIENKYSPKFLNIIYKMIQTDENKRCDFIELNEEVNKIF